MTPHEHVVWEWVDEHGVPKYVGYGSIKSRKHPALQLWEDRFSKKSHLNNWLQSLEAEPKRSGDVPKMLMHRQGARSVCHARRQQLKAVGIPLLSTRPFGSTYGGGCKRAVISPAGVRYKSVRSAAEILGYNQGSITRFCNDKHSGWRYEN